MAPWTNTAATVCPVSGSVNQAGGPRSTIRAPTKALFATMTTTTTRLYQRERMSILQRRYTSTRVDRRVTKDNKIISRPCMNVVDKHLLVTTLLPMRGVSRNDLGPLGAAPALAPTTRRSTTTCDRQTHTTHLASCVGTHVPSGVASKK